MRFYKFTGTVDNKEAKKRIFPDYMSENIISNINIEGNAIDSFNIDIECSGRQYDDIDPNYVDVVWGLEELYSSNKLNLLGKVEVYQVNIEVKQVLAWFLDHVEAHRDCSMDEYGGCTCPLYDTSYTVRKGATAVTITADDSNIYLSTQIYEDGSVWDHRFIVKVNEYTILDWGNLVEDGVVTEIVREITSLTGLSVTFSKGGLPVTTVLGDTTWEWSQK